MLGSSCQASGVQIMAQSSFAINVHLSLSGLPPPALAALTLGIPPQAGLASLQALIARPKSTNSIYASFAAMSSSPGSGRTWPSHSRLRIFR